MIAHSSGRGLRRVARYISAGLAAVCGLACLSLSANAQSTKRLPGHLPDLVTQSNLVGPVAPQQILTLALALPLRNTAQLDALSSSLYDPKDPQFGKYLTPQQFTDQFGPTQADYDAVAAYVRAQGLTVTTTHPNRLVMDIQGTAQAVQTAFGVHLHMYKAPDGRIFRAPDADPVLPAAIGNRLTGVIGLDTATVFRKPPVAKPVDPLAFLNPPAPVNFGDPAALAQLSAAPVSRNGGSAPGGGFGPSDLRTAYNLNVPLDGTGEVLGLVEFDGYIAGDITAYENTFGLPHTLLENVLIDGYNGLPATPSGQAEVSLDIEMMVALAPNVSRIIVYESPNTVQAGLDQYSRIATENRAKSVSTSWGYSGEPPAISASEEPLFMQMKAQGQSFYSASGDNGAYYDGVHLGPSDPSSPNICTVGGTRLSTNGPGGTWSSESAWIDGGGGISAIWSIPPYQLGLANAGNLGSATHRNIPDVSLDADPNSGEYIVVNGSGFTIGGTSAAAPLWAGFTALLNQELILRGRPRLGFPNTTLYALAAGPTYTQDFHDITAGTNQFYPAVTGYDLATGLGTLNGTNMINDISGSTITPPPPPVELMGNGGFENGAAHQLPWVATTGVISNSAKEPAFEGRWKAWLTGYGAPHTDSLYQTVTIPARATSVSLSFKLLVDSNPLYVNYVYDTLTVQVRSTSGRVLATLGTASNADNTGGSYASVTIDVTQFKGQTVQIYLVSKETGYVGQTSFVLDAFSMLATLPPPARSN